MRAVSALLVFVWHYEGLPLGWAGVDIFFVLSGFLITDILFDLQHHRDRWRRFYVARALRIFPLGYATLVALFGLGLWAGVALQPKWWLWFLYARNLDPSFYVQSAENPNVIGRLIVGHFWSLCVEEQFYMLWPALVFWLRDRDRIATACVWIIVLVSTARVVLSVTAPGGLVESGMLYRLTPIRVDALAMGGWLAMTLRTDRRAQLLNSGAAILSMSMLLLVGVLVVGSVIAGFDVAAHPYGRLMGGLGLVLLDLAAVGAVLLALDTGSRISRVLSLRQLRSFGRITYGFYVFHAVPILLVQQTGGGIASTLVAFAAISSVTWLSFYCFESPILRWKDRLLAEPVGAVLVNAPATASESRAV